MKRFRERAQELLEKVAYARENEEYWVENALKENCCFLSDDEIYCGERKIGDSRYPYTQDGFTLWAKASGDFSISEGAFNVVLDAFSGKESPICFYAGIKDGEEYFPVSLTGAGKFPFEKDVERFTVFSPEAAYYFTVTKVWTSCVRAFVDTEKNVRFSVCLFAKEKIAETYVSFYFNPFLRYAYADDIGVKFFKSCKRMDDGFLVSVTEDVFRHECRLHYAYVALERLNNPLYTTTAKSDFTGGTNISLNCAESLIKGRFERQKTYTEFTDIAVVGTIVPMDLPKDSYFETSYTVSIADDRLLAQRKAVACTQTNEIDKILYNAVSDFGKRIPAIQFGGLQSFGVQDVAFNRFVRSVFRQVEFCSRAKNYAGALMGVRDIFQQLEAALLWEPKYCREKIVEALHFIGDDGRPPRQYSYPSADGALPEMDLRPFIDQGVWIVSTVYTYLAYTDDWSILEEICGYYRFDGNKVAFSNQKDSVFCHLKRIIDWLISNLDVETNCLHILYGDWNDSLDGLGACKDGGTNYGTGVSVMATLQLYQNLTELFEICRKLGRMEECAYYKKMSENISFGLQKYAIETNANGERKILHGWGDKRSYTVGGWHDSDGKSRDGLMATAFWALSGLLKKDESLKTDILRAYSRLDSRYGLKTFEPYFAMENKDVGRITHLPRGTAENGATYVHATAFAIWSLFEMGEYELAWAQIEKILPLTHDTMTTSPFVMPNSYSYDEEKGFDGESMGDWFTGSACVLIKILVWEIFGLKVNLDSLSISPAKLLPFKRLSAKFALKGGEIDFVYENKGKSTRVFIVNDCKTDYINLSNEELRGKTVKVRIID